MTQKALNIQLEFPDHQQIQRTLFKIHFKALSLLQRQRHIKVSSIYNADHLQISVLDPVVLLICPVKKRTHQSTTDQNNYNGRTRPGGIIFDTGNGRSLSR